MIVNVVRAVRERLERPAGALVMPLAYGVVASLLSHGLAVVQPVTALCAAVARGRPAFAPLSARNPYTLAVAALLGWMVLSLAWTTDGARPDFALRVVLVAACGLVLCGAAAGASAAQARFTGIGLAAGSAVGMLIVLEETFTAGAVARVLLEGVRDRPETYSAYLSAGPALMSCVLWLCFAFARRWAGPPAVAIVAAAFVAIGLRAGAGAAVAGVCIGLGVLALVRLAPGAGARLVRIGIVAAILLMPVLPWASNKGEWLRDLTAGAAYSASHRLEVWSFTAERIADRPLFGWGFDAARAIPGGGERLDPARDLGVTGTGIRGKAVRMPLHPHNGVLQVWLELGLVGAALLAGLAWRLMRGLDRLGAGDAGLRAVLHATVASTFTIFCLSFGVWQSRWQAAMWMVAALCIVAAGHRRPRAKE